MATVSEYLLIQIGIDVNKIKKDAKEAKRELTDLEQHKIKLVEAFKKGEEKVKSFFAVLAGSSSISAFIANITSADAALNRLSKTTGMSVENISAWSNAAEHMGGSAGEMQAGIAGISKEMTKFKYTGDSTLVPFLNQMGVNILDNNGKMKDQTQIMLELADQAQKMPKEDFSNLASMNGFNQSQINLMLQGRKALEAQLKEQNKNNLVTKQQAEEAAKAEAAWADLKQAFMGVARAVAYVLIPPLIGVAKILTAMFTFMGNHKETLGVLFLFAIPKLLAFNKGFLILLRYMTGITPVLKLATFAMRGFGLTSLIALAPLLLIGTALGLLLDDFMTFQAGGDSLIPWGSIFGGAKEAIKDIKDLVFSLGNFSDLLKALATGDWASAKAIGMNILENLTPTAIMQRFKKDMPAQVSAQPDTQTPSQTTEQAPQATDTQQNSSISQQSTGVSEQAVANVGNQIGENVASGIDFKKLANRLTNYAHAKSLGKCAAYVREALEAGGADMNGHPINAGEYHTKGFLKSKGWNEQGKDGYKPQAGDVVVFSGQGKHKIGHIATYNGSQWISDFKQKNMAVWRDIKNPEYHVYRAGANTAMKKGFKPVRNSAPVNNNMVSAGQVLFGRNAPKGTHGNYFKYDDLITKAAAQQGIPANILKGLIHQESQFDPNARSPTGAKGLGQFTTIALKDQKLKGYNINPWNPEQSIFGAARVLKDNYKKFGDWTPAIAAYNAGAGAVARNGNKPLTDTAEHRNYARLVLQHAKEARFAKGFSSQNTAEGTGQVPYIIPPVGAKAHHAIKHGGGSTHNTINSNTSIHTVNIVADKAEQAGKAFLHEMQKARELKNPWWKAAQYNNSAMM